MESKEAAVEVSRFCTLCYHEWKEQATRERLREIIKNRSVDCPKCSNKSLKSLGITDGGSPQ